MMALKGGILGKVAASGSLSTTAGKQANLWGYSFVVGTATQATLTFRNGASGATILAYDANVAVTAAGDVTKVVMFPAPIRFTGGIYPVLAGTNTALYIYYEEEL
jgi:hypothetical protein